MFQLKNWRSYGNLKIWPIFWPGDLVPWPTYLSMLHTGTADPFHMWTKFGDDMSKRSWVMLDKTDRQTDRQTNRQTNILANFFEILASNNRWVSMSTSHHGNIYIIFFFTQHNKSLNDHRNEALHTSTFVSLTQDKDCRWHHKCITQCNNCYKRKKTDLSC